MSSVQREPCVAKAGKQNLSKNRKFDTGSKPDSRGGAKDAEKEKLKELDDITGAVVDAAVNMCRSGPDFSLNANPSRDWKIL